MLLQLSWNTKSNNNNALGTTAAELTVASGATLDFANVTYSTAEAVTVNGGTIQLQQELVHLQVQLHLGHTQRLMLMVHS